MHGESKKAYIIFVGNPEGMKPLGMLELKLILNK
jgi:hypothetical protein